uniref:Uncharacterized protein n=1 Tax=Hyaloperonospora arabidopsidis (strain Emoy2) TaxID=559515 RepID=M4C304_HYAAE
MVVFHVQRGACCVFVYQAPSTTSNDALIYSLYKVYNLRVRLSALVDVLESGPVDCNADKDVLWRAVMDAKMALESEANVAQRICSTESELMEKFQNIRQAVAWVFPMELPSLDMVQLLLDEERTEESLAEPPAALDVLSSDTVELWWAGKQFTRGKDVCDVVGKNDKSTLIVTLQKQGDGVPRRQSVVRAEERDAVTALCSQEKQKRQQQVVKDDAEDYYKISPWADPSMLKNSLRGTDNIRPF